MVGCDQTVTVVRCDGEDYTCTVIDGVSWYEKLQVTVKDTGMVSANIIKVRIPSDNLPEGVLPLPGDIIIKGGASGIERPTDLAAYTHAKVMGVGDNRRGRLPHVAVTCQ